VRHASYSALLTGVAPLARLYLRASGRRALLERFKPPLPEGLAAPLWIHGCSVGESALTVRFAEALRGRFPSLPLLLTASTATGRSVLDEKAADFPRAWFPFDTARAVRHFLDGARPRLLVLIETEIWPNLLLACYRRQIPVVVVNGRLSTRHFERYQRHSRFFTPLFQGFTAVGAQHENYGARFKSLGAPPEAITITGSMKFDGGPTEIAPRHKVRLRSMLGLGDSPVLVFGSTRPGDEALALEVFRALQGAFPRLRLIIAPRHIERAAEIEALAPVRWARFSQVAPNKPPERDTIILVDTIGQLVDLYGIGTVAVIGGSFFPGVEGHNPLESAALGTPTVFGPYMQNFQDPVDVLLRAEGAIQLAQPDQLVDTIGELLRNGAEHRQLGTRGRKAVLDNRGALDRNIDLIVRILGKEAAATGAA